MPQLGRDVLAGTDASHQRAIKIKAGEFPSRGIHAWSQRVDMRCARSLLANPESRVALVLRLQADSHDSKSG
jgi:hypothetical protein